MLGKDDCDSDRSSKLSTSMLSPNPPLMGRKRSSDRGTEVIAPSEPSEVVLDADDSALESSEAAVEGASVVSIHVV
jgi:hypothetical protein